MVQPADHPTRLTSQPPLLHPEPCRWPVVLLPRLTHTSAHPIDCLLLFQCFPPVFTWLTPIDSSKFSQVSITSSRKPSVDGFTVLPVLGIPC